MKLNVGCGNHYAPGWVNVDLNSTVNPDVVCVGVHLPFPDGMFTAVYAGHVLEHLDYHPDVPTALTEMVRVLAPNGTICLVGPDVDLADTFPPDIAHGARYGAGRWAGDVHRWPCTEALLLNAARKVGLTATPVDLDVVAATGWPIVSLAGWQTAVTVTL